MTGTQIDIKIAGIPMRLNFNDTELHRQFLSRFQVSRPRGYGGQAEQTILTLEIQPSKAAQCSNPHRMLDGFGEYKGMLDIEKGRGYVTIISASPVNALANCLRQIYTRLIIANDGLVMHAACIVKDSHAYVFAGKSRAGKSTVCDLSPDCLIASDDLTAVRKRNGEFLACGMPGTGSRNSPGSYKINGVFRLVQDTENRLIPLIGARAVADILALPRTPTEPLRIRKMLKFLEELTDNILCYKLHFRKDPSFWAIIMTELEPRMNTDVHR